MLERLLFVLLFMPMLALNAAHPGTAKSPWDIGKVAKNIDQYWIQSEEELAHRKELADLVQDLYTPGESFLEVGCGSGLVYEALVPNIVSEKNYIGIDNSQKMLSLAKKRFSKGNFKYDDLLSLSLSNNSVDMVAAFEVLGHLTAIEKPISEMFRVASHMVIFTVWSAPETICTYENIEGTEFPHYAYSVEDILEIISRNVDQMYGVTVIPLANSINAYVIIKYAF